MKSVILQKSLPNKFALDIIFIIANQFIETKITIFITD